VHLHDEIKAEFNDMMHAKTGAYILDKAGEPWPYGRVVWLRQRLAPDRPLQLVDRINQYRLYQLAVALHAIPEWRASEELSSIGLYFGLKGARDALEPYCGSMPPMRLVVSLNAAAELLDLIKQYLERIPAPFAGSPSDEDERTRALEPWRLMGVHTALQKFETLLSAECETRPAFIAPKRGIYDTEELVNTAAHSIPESLMPMISGKPADELDSAGRCLAFGLFTASGFHICRAVEAVLEKYYNRFTEKSGTLRGWQDYINALNEAIAAGHKPSADPQTCQYLGNLKSSSRNPIMHPRVILNEADAFTVFDLGRGLIGRMAQELLAASRQPRARKPRMKAAV
jgi:hypothetical protein